MTRTQLAALAELREHGRLWPTGRGRFRTTGTGHSPYARATLQALVDLGHARWADHGHGVMPHIVPTDGPEGSPDCPTRTR
jgi:hypothetical protein